MLAILGGGMIIFFILILLFIIVEIVALWKMFKKAGKNGWESIVPFYSSFVLTEIAGLNWWWFLFLIINFKFEYNFTNNISLGVSLFGFIGNFNCYYNIARRFGKDKTAAIFAGIFPYIFVLIFGFSKNEVYNSDIIVGVNGIFSSEDMINNNTSDINCNNNQSTDTVNKDISNNDYNLKNEYSFCGNCGKKLNNKDKYCSNCGREKDIK